MPRFHLPVFILSFVLFAMPVFAQSSAESPAPDLAKGAELRMMAFNIWGDYFGNPPHEREGQILAVIQRFHPDLLALQEVTPNWWKSPLFAELKKANFANICTEKDGKNNFVPLLYRQDRLELLESGFELYHEQLDRTKGFTYGVFKDRKTGKRFIAFSTHFMYKEGPEFDQVRVQNADHVCRRMAELQKKWDCPALGGGDINCNVSEPAHKRMAESGFISAQEVAQTASPERSRHGDPVRGDDGKYHGTLAPEENEKAFSIDHIFVEPQKIQVQVERVVLDQDALDASDHSPIFIDFSLK